jgi:hypothetical protein
VEEVLGRWQEVVGLGVEALRDELLLDARVPEVLDLVVRAAGEVLRDLRPPVSTTRRVQSPGKFHAPQLAGRAEGRHEHVTGFRGCGGRR